MLLESSNSSCSVFQKAPNSLSFAKCAVIEKSDLLIDIIQLSMMVLKYPDS